ncbi:MAG: toll/interleukin-1 receptor domain-containing protein [Pseudomonadota bacterium]
MAKFFISYNSADSQKAQWIAWTLEEMGHTAFVHEWEIAGGQSIPKWMEDRLGECDHVLAVFSPDYIDAAYSMSERHSAFWRDPVGREGRLLPVIVRPCAMPELLHDRKRIDLLDLDEEDAVKLLADFIAPPKRPDKRPAFQREASASFAEAPAKAPTPPPPYQRVPSNRFILNNLPTPHSDDLIGRDEELALLTDEWALRTDRNILALIAEGGTGKSFLVSTWLARLRMADPRPYGGAQRIFTWSFYSQGSKGQVTSSEAFFLALLKSFDQPGDDLDTLGRADAAVRLVAEQEMILVLDGVEPLQNPTNHADAGRFYDTVLGEFLKRLAAQDWPGLVIVTSRQRLADLRTYEGTAVRHEDVNHLGEQDGALLLRDLKVDGPKDDMRQAVREMSGHAFALVLLARYLTHIRGTTDIRKRDHADLLDQDIPGSEKAKWMLQAYADRFGPDSAEAAMLHILGLFDRPAPKAGVEAVLGGEAIPDLTEAFHGAKPARLNPVLKRLEDINLITRPDDATIDGHPLVREHFGKVLQDARPQAWRAAHSRLFDYFCALPKEDQPSTEATLMPLYQSLHHGVAADRAQEALERTYVQRIRRGGGDFAVKNLGLFGTELAALAPFFQGDWGNPGTSVTLGEQGFLLNQAGFRLRALGRLQEARLPFEQRIDRSIKHGDDNNAALDSSNLSELLLTLGDLEDARVRAEDAVNLIDRTDDALLQFIFRTTLADALAHLGQRKQAADLFFAAECRQRAVRPREPYLYSLRGYRYASFMIRRAAPTDLDALTSRVEATLALAEEHLGLLDVALDRLNLAVLAARRVAPEAAGQFDTALTALRTAGQRDHLPRGYLARAGFRRGQGDLPGAWDDLAEVRAIAEPSGMRLFLCDALIQEAWLHHAAGDIDDVRAAYEQAKAEVTDMHYHMRDPDLADLAKALGLPPD